jgi:hypothetical protein
MNALYIIILSSYGFIMKASRLIDVHHHIIPEEYSSTLEYFGVAKSGGITSIPKRSIIAMLSSGVHFLIGMPPDFATPKYSRVEL